MPKPNSVKASSAPERAVKRRFFMISGRYLLLCCRHFEPKNCYISLQDELRS